MLAAINQSALSTTISIRTIVTAKSAGRWNMITQVELVNGNWHQVNWVRSKSVPKVGNLVTLDGSNWSITKVYVSMGESEVHNSHGTSKTYGSLEQSCF